MKTVWALQDAKNRFSEVVDKTLSAGAQTVTRRGVPVVVIVPADEYAGKNGRKESLAAFFRNSPLYGLGLEFSRSGDTGRPVTL